MGERQAWRSGEREFAAGLQSISQQLGSENESTHKSLGVGQTWDSGSFATQGDLQYVGHTWDPKRMESGYSNETMSSSIDSSDTPPKYGGSIGSDDLPQKHKRRIQQDSIGQEKNFDDESHSLSFQERLEAEQKNSSSPLQWDSNQVAEWLEKLGLPAQAFKESGVTGEDLFALTKGENSLSGNAAMKKLRPFIARRVVYEAERLMGMILEKSIDHPSIPYERRHISDKVDAGSPLNGYVKNNPMTQGFDNNITHQSSGVPSSSLLITPIKPLNSSKPTKANEDEEGIYEPPVEPYEPLEPPPIQLDGKKKSNHLMTGKDEHDKDDDSDNDSNDTISSNNSEVADEVSAIRESLEYKHEDFEDYKSTDSASSSVQSIASPSGSLDVEVNMFSYPDGSGGSAKQVSSHRDIDWLKKAFDPPAEGKHSLAQPTRQINLSHKLSERRNSSNTSLNLMAAIAPSPVADAKDKTRIPSLQAKDHHHHHHHHHHHLQTYQQDGDDHKHDQSHSKHKHHHKHKHKDRESSGKKRYVSFVAPEVFRSEDKSETNTNEEGYQVMGSIDTIGSMDSESHEPSSFDGIDGERSRRLSLYKMTELLNNSFPEKSEKDRQAKRRVSFGPAEMKSYEMDHEESTPANSTLETMSSVETLGSYKSPPSSSLSSYFNGHDKKEEGKKEDNIYKEADSSQMSSPNRRLSLYKMTELLNSSFPSKESSGDSEATTPRRRSIVMNKVQSRKIDYDENQGQYLAPEEPKLMSATASRHGHRKSADSAAGLTPTNSLMLATSSRHSYRRSTGNDSDLIPLNSFDLPATSGTPKHMKKNRSLKVAFDGQEDNQDHVQVEKERKMKSGRKSKKVKPTGENNSVSSEQNMQNGEIKKKNRGIARIVLDTEPNDMPAGGGGGGDVASSNSGSGEVKKKNRGIARIVLDTEPNDMPAGGNDGSSEAVCISGGGGRLSGESKSRLKSLKSDQPNLLQTPKKKEMINGDFTEEGEFTFGEWTLNEDGIESMPREELSTARATHGRTSSGRSTPYSSRGHNHSSQGNSSIGFSPSPPGYDLFHPTSNALSTPREGGGGGGGGGHYLAQPSRKPGLSSILSDDVMNPLDVRHQPLNSIQLNKKLGDIPSISDGHHHHHSRSKHHHKHRHHHSRDSVSSQGSSDGMNLTSSLDELGESMQSSSSQNRGKVHHRPGRSMRDSNGTWGSVEMLSKIQAEGGPRSHSPDSILSDDTDMVNQASLNNSLTSRNGRHGDFSNTLRSENSALGESYDEVLMSSLKFDKNSMPIGGAGGDFEAENRGFRVKKSDSAGDLFAPGGFRPMSGNLMNTPLRPKSSQETGRATTPNTPRKTKMNLVKLEELGRGAGGVVYKAVHIPTMTVVAVKHIFVEDDGKRRQMQRELNLLHAFNTKPLQQRHNLGNISHLSRNHPINLFRENLTANSNNVEGGNENKADDDESEEQKIRDGFGSHVVSIYDAYADKADRSVCLVLEYMSGGSLESFVKEHRRLSEAQIAHIARSCFLALSDLKKRRLLHRDIKPANILIDHLGNVKLSDFGIMKEFEEDSLSKTFTGTLAYMSPERILCGSGQSDEGYSYPADIWGVGLSLLALGLGKEPFPLVRSIWDVLSCQDETKNAVPSLRNRDNFANLEKINSDNPNDYLYSADLCDMVDCCLRRDPKLRLTADELLRHPFFDKYPACQNVAGLLTSEKTVRSYGSALREQEEKAGEVDMPFEPPPPPLFGMFQTPETAATRMLVAIIKNMNPEMDKSNDSGGEGNNSARGGMSHGGERSKKFFGLSPEILDRLRSQLPGIDESRFQQLHDRALKGLEGDERRKALMSWMKPQKKK